MVLKRNLRLCFKWIIVAFVSVALVGAIFSLTGSNINASADSSSSSSDNSIEAPKWLQNPDSQSDLDSVKGSAYAGMLINDQSYAYFGTNSGGSTYEIYPTDGSSIGGAIGSTTKSGGPWGSIYALFLKRAYDTGMLKMYNSDVSASVATFIHTGMVWATGGILIHVGLGLSYLASTLHNWVMDIFDAVDIWTYIDDINSNMSLGNSFGASMGQLFHNIQSVAKLVLFMVFSVGIAGVIMNTGRHGSRAQGFLHYFGKLFIFFFIVGILPGMMSGILSQYSYGTSSSSESAALATVRENLLDVTSWTKISIDRTNDGHVSYGGVNYFADQTNNHLVYLPDMANSSEVSTVVSQLNKASSNDQTSSAGSAINTASSWMPDGTDLEVLNSQSDLSASQMVDYWLDPANDNFNTKEIAQQLLHYKTTSTNWWDDLFGSSSDNYTLPSDASSEKITAAKVDVLKTFNLMMTSNSVTVDSSGKVRYADVVMPGDGGSGLIGRSLKLGGDLILSSLFALIIYVLAFFTIIKMFARTFINAVKAVFTGSPKYALTAIMVVALGMTDLMISAFLISIEEAFTNIF